MNTQAFAMAMALMAVGYSYAPSALASARENQRLTTCAVSINGSGSAEGGLTLPSVAARDLARAGARAGRRGWRVQVGSDLQPCHASSVQIAFHDSGNVNAQGRLDNVGSAERVDVVLINLNDGGADINLRTGANSQVRIIPPMTGFVILNYAAEYYATGSAGGGLVSTSVQYDLIYR